MGVPEISTACTRYVPRRSGGRAGIGWVGPLIFSPDSQRVAYAAEEGDKQFVVVAGEEGKQYAQILEGGAIISESPNSLRYLALRLNNGMLSVYLVEETIK